MNDNEMRDALYRAVHEEFVGPMDPMSTEEIRLNPKKAYPAGVLHPKGAEIVDMLEDVVDEEDFPASVFDQVGHGVIVESKSSSLSDEEEPVSLSNAELQSAISLTVSVKEGDILDILVNAGRYESSGSDGKPLFKRVPIVHEFKEIAVPSSGKRTKELAIPDTRLSVLLVYRYGLPSGDSVVTVALKNDERSDDPYKCEAESCYFQVGFSLRSKKSFSPLPADLGDKAFETEEELCSRLIYSEIKNYAIGHGCAADWSGADSSPMTVCTKTIPMSEVRPTMSRVPALDGVSFDMHLLGDEARWKEAKASLEALCFEYSRWIGGIDSEASSFDEEWKREAANINVSACRAALDRMWKGLRILDEDPIALRAFQLANKAMLIQHIHYSVVSNACDHFEEEREGLRVWRPFQIAFLLMNIESMVDPESDDRRILDLIWFPTGGGKTEAYLGLSAFSLVLERLKRESCLGTSIIMRYTLRLLSSQQFSRAASFICALEVMRRANPEMLGERRFSIGFWVGGSASPNNWDSAVRIFKALRNGSATEGSIPVTQCPWCGAPMGGGGEGYKKERNRDKKRDGKEYLIFVCPNEDCDFHDRKNPLPLMVVDDEIYFEPPSLLLGTVDKFATVPFRPKSYAIFGIDGAGNRIHSPKLIIQDELHLISGPLGSMAAHYETLISDLCRDTRGGSEIGPKVVASTATVSRAKEQCHELFACGRENVSQFPPSGVSYRDSFFARLDGEGDGRRYVGIYAPNISFATASIKLYTQLLWEPFTWELEDECEMDRYWSVVGYYGTTRELGQALTWTASDIPERLYEKRKKFGLKRKGRYLNEVIELTGRKDAPEVRDGLDRLALKRSEHGCVDLCLATNMISVGLDVPRLGTMVVAGQPKETSEYIQATSRVGRSGDSRGIVFVLYGATRPRDRSHYENFRNYHESFYQHVEPSSITAFCAQVRKRALAGTVFGLYRSKNPGMEMPDDPDEDMLDWLYGVLQKRVEKVDSDEVDDMLDQLDEIVKEWRSNSYARWSTVNPEPFAESEEALPLMHPYGGRTNINWGDSSFEAPLSMRSVDKECKVAIVGRYPSESDEEDGK